MDKFAERCEALQIDPCWRSNCPPCKAISAVFSSFREIAQLQGAFSRPETASVSIGDFCKEYNGINASFVVCPACKKST